MFISELYRCLQGEGKLLGTPSILVRTSSCNLRCQWGETKCDTPYTSWFPEGKLMSVDEVVDEVVKLAAPNVNHVIISGGEPTLQQDLKQLVFELSVRRNFHTTLETNGTKNVEHLTGVLWSISPKLKSSTPVGTEWEARHEKERINLDTLATLVATYDSYLKFVIMNKTDLDEVRDIVNWIGERAPLPGDRVYLMPEGRTQVEIRERQLWVAEEAQRLGFKYSPRLHIDLYGDKRGV